MIKKEEIANPNSCLSKADDDEPVFVLRGQDITAPAVIRYWCLLNETAPPEKLAEAKALAAAMDQWPTRKMPD